LEVLFGVFFPHLVRRAITSPLLPHAFLQYVEPPISSGRPALVVQRRPPRERFLPDPLRIRHLLVRQVDVDGIVSELIVRTEPRSLGSAIVASAFFFPWHQYVPKRVSPLSLLVGLENTSRMCFMFFAIDTSFFQQVDPNPLAFPPSFSPPHEQFLRGIRDGPFRRSFFFLMRSSSTPTGRSCRHSFSRGCAFLQPYFLPRGFSPQLSCPAFGSVEYLFFPGLSI